MGGTGGTGGFARAGGPPPDAGTAAAGGGLCGPGEPPGPGAARRCQPGGVQRPLLPARVSALSSLGLCCPVPAGTAAPRAVVVCAWDDKAASRRARPVGAVGGFCPLPSGGCPGGGSGSCPAPLLSPIPLPRSRPSPRVPVLPSLPPRCTFPGRKVLRVCGSKWPRPGPRPAPLPLLAMPSRRAAPLPAARQLAELPCGWGLPWLSGFGWDLGQGQWWFFFWWFFFGP